ncbi:unnamed protein product [Paramecium pentaurelia]|uniref:Tetratricopeptide repeat protein n=1 Tax=Paramecium pentaurelia TaxID=43138 RepID=A0A8S1XIX0_9CILI|nr:unnamed protein product [Paramecium pentaurelia]
MMNRFEEALEWYDKLLVINPQHTDSLYGKTQASTRIIYQQYGGEIVSIFNQKGDCLKMIIDYQSITWAFFMGKSECLSISYGMFKIKMMKHFNQALKQYDEALNINPQDVQSLWGRSDCLQIMNQFELAFEFEFLIKHQSQTQNIYYLYMVKLNVHMPLVIMKKQIHFQ